MLDPSFLFQKSQIPADLMEFFEPAECGECYVCEMVAVFREVRRVLRDDGTLWLNIGDSYCTVPYGPGAANTSDPKFGPGRDRAAGRANRRPMVGIKHKDMLGIPWMLAFALRADGWYLRSDVIWAKPNVMPGSQGDRCTSSHEHVFLLSKRDQYFSDFDAIKTPPRESTRVRIAQDLQAQAGSHRANGGAKTNGPMKAAGCADPAMMRDVWFVSPGGYSDAHFAVMPAEIARRCILAGSPPNGAILDPFGGAGTTALVADRLGRDCTLIELNPTYADMARRRIGQDAGLFAEVIA